MYIFFHACMYVGRQAWVSVCMSVSVMHEPPCMFVNMQLDMPEISIYASIHINSMQSAVWPEALAYIHFTLLTYVPEQICLLHCTYLSNCTTTVFYKKNVHTSKKEQMSTFIYHASAIYVPTLSIPLKWHIYTKYEISSCADTRQLYQYIYLIWTHCNDQCDQKHWYTYTSHYWYIPMNKYICHTAHLSHSMSTVLYI